MEMTCVVLSAASALVAAVQRVKMAMSAIVPSLFFITVLFLLFKVFNDYPQ